MVLTRGNGKERNVTSDGKMKRRRVEAIHPNPRMNKRRRLTRPKKPVTFSLPQHIIDSQDSTTLSSSPAVLATKKSARSRSSTPNTDQAKSDGDSPLLRLSRINVLLNAIHRRNKNQHRNQPFYRHLSSLRKSVGNLTSFHEQAAAIAKIAKSTTKPGGQPTTAASARERFEKESRLRSQREVLEEYIRETIVPSAYVAFSGVVADTQFANLGIVLLGILADVAGVVGLMRTIEEVKPIRRANDASRETSQSRVGGRLFALSTVVTGPDHGTVVERVYDSDNDGMAIEAVNQGSKPLQTQDEMMMDLGEVIQREEFDQGRDKLESAQGRASVFRASKEFGERVIDAETQSIQSVNEDGYGSEKSIAETAMNMASTPATVNQNTHPLNSLLSPETADKFHHTGPSSLSKRIESSPVGTTTKPLARSKKSKSAANNSNPVANAGTYSIGASSSVAERVSTTRASTESTSTPITASNYLSNNLKQTSILVDNGVNNQSGRTKPGKQPAPTEMPDTTTEERKAGEIRKKQKETREDKDKNTTIATTTTAAVATAAPAVDRRGQKEEKKSKSKRKKNAIDDLFSGFG